MRLSSIPRGVVVFIGALAIILIGVIGYRILWGPSSSGTGTTQNSFFSTLFPFGNGAGPKPQQNDTGQGNGGNLNNTPTGSVPLLRHVTAAPVAGAWFVKGATATSTPLIRYMDRSTGHIEETPADSYADIRISNTTIPGIEELYAPLPNGLVLRYINSDGILSNVYGLVSTTTPDGTVTTFPLPPFKRIAADRNGNILTVTESFGGSQVQLSKVDGSKSQSLFSSKIASWVPLLGGGRTFLESAPSAFALGYIYELKNGALLEEAGGFSGLTAIVSPSGDYLAISSDTAEGFSLSVLSTKDSSGFILPIHAFALKCSWIPTREPLLFCAVPLRPPEAAYPDDWLLGNVSLADQGWILNPKEKIAFFIGDLADERGGRIDAENVSVDETGSYALFMDKNDLSLWSLRITEAITRAQIQ
jgi:hypothetical protein